MPVFLFDGVPPLPPDVGLPPPPPPPLLTADAPGMAAFGPPAWGIFDQGLEPVLVASSTAAIEYNRDWTISDYPVEQGGFFSYNKVVTPYKGIITYWVGGGISERSQFLTSVEQAVSALDLFTVVMPEISYDNANITHYSYRRDARGGVTLLRVDVWVQEVLQIGVATFSATQSVNGATPRNGGTVQPQTPSQAGVPGGTPTPPPAGGASPF